MGSNPARGTIFAPALRLRAKAMQTILTVRTTNRGTWRETFGGISEFAKTCAWNVQPVDARHRPPDCRQLLGFWHPAGIVVDASGGAANLRGCDFGGTPAVAINPDERIGGSIPEIANDPDEIAKLALAELLGLNPATLVFAEWFQRREWMLRRLDAARRIAAMHGMRVAVISPGPCGDSDAVGAIGRLADALKPLPRPIGVFAAADDIGALVLDAAARLGLRVPDDVAVTAVDDDPEVCENCSPTLTSIRPDYRRMGFEAAALLHSLIGGGGAPARSTVPLVGIIRRASTTGVPKGDRKVADALELIRLHSCNGLSTADVVKTFGTSLHTAEDRFRAATGKTIGQEIISRRLAAACGYLREGRASIAAIAGFCGWNGAAAFRKAFKAKFGVSPAKWTRAEVPKEVLSHPRS